MERKRRIDVLEVCRLFENEIQRTFGVEHFFGRYCLAIFIFDTHICKNCRSREERFLQFGGSKSIFNTCRGHHKIGIFNQRGNSRIVMAIDHIYAILLQNRRKITRWHRICGIFRHRICALLSPRFRRTSLRLHTFQVRHNGYRTTTAYALERNSRTDLTTTKNN